MKGPNGERLGDPVEGEDTAAEGFKVCADDGIGALVGRARRRLSRRRQEEPLTIEDIKRVHLSPGDDLVVRTGALSEDARGRIIEQLQGLWPNNRIIFIEDDVELEVVTPNPTAAWRELAAIIGGDSAAQPGVF